MRFCGVVHRVGLAVELDVQFFAFVIGPQVHGGLHETADGAAGVVGVGEFFSGDLCQCAFGSVGDEFDGVDELFSPGTKLCHFLSLG